MLLIPRRHNCERRGHHLQHRRIRPPRPRRASRTHKARALLFQHGKTLRPCRLPERLDSMLGDRAEHSPTHSPFLKPRIHLNKDNDGASHTDERDALRPQSSTEENQAQKDGLNCKERGEAFQQPDLQQASGLRARAAVHITNEEAVG